AAEAFEAMIFEARARAVGRLLDAPPLARADVEALEQQRRRVQTSARPGEHDDDGEAVRGTAGARPLRDADAHEASAPVEGGLELADLADGSGERHEPPDPAERE